jgi:hypothetical protein
MDPAATGDRIVTQDHETEPDDLVERLEDSKGWPNLGKAAAARIRADANVIGAAEDHLVKRLKALQTYFDLSNEELESMTPDERADTMRQHRLIAEALASFRQALQARAALAEQERKL